MGWSVARDRLVQRALDDGWAAVGVGGVAAFDTARGRALAAVEEGRLDGMPWFSRERVEKSADLRPRYPWARAVVSLAWAYRPAVPLEGLGAGEVGQGPAGAPGRPRGRVAAYACLPGEGSAPVDYHDRLAQGVDRLVHWLEDEFADVRCKAFIDHGWAMDKPIAERAGVGFVGKNTTLISQAAGSYVLLADLLVSLPLPPTPVSQRSCGSCRACLPACPTGALVAPGVMDARRCISYLTIEHKGSIPEDLRPLMGTWVFGCDLCMEACPINQRLAPAAGKDPGPSTRPGPVPFPDLVECLELTDDEFAARFRGTAIWRAGRGGLARNAAIALANAGDGAAITVLKRARDSDPDPVVREAAEWAMLRLGQVTASAASGDV
jgi:epoxyqueuosine reductase